MEHGGAAEAIGIPTAADSSFPLPVSCSQQRTEDDMSTVVSTASAPPQPWALSIPSVHCRHGVHPTHPLPPQLLSVCNREPGRHTAHPHPIACPWVRVR